MLVVVFPVADRHVLAVPLNASREVDASAQPDLFQRLAAARNLDEEGVVVDVESVDEKIACLVVTAKIDVVQMRTIVSRRGTRPFGVDGDVTRLPRASKIGRGEISGHGVYRTT